MKWLVAGLAAILIVGVACFVAVRRLAAADPIYSVSQLDAGLRHDPAAWVGRSVRVRGIVGFCPVRIGCAPNIPPILIPKLGQPSPDPPLQLSFGADDSMQATLHGLPLLGALIPQRPLLKNGYEGVVRVRIRPVALGACFERLCFEGELQDWTLPLGNN